MNINASIIDQQLSGIQDDIRDYAQAELNINQAEKLKSLAFVYLCVKVVLDLNFEETFDCLTEGGGDFGVDAIHLTEAIDGEFTVTLFQAKYKNNLLANSNFEENGINALINAIRHIFNPAAELGTINERLQVKVETARAMIRDGAIPRVRAIACNNGLRWNESTQAAIDRTGFGEQVIWEHVNHDYLIKLLQQIKNVNETLRLTGKAIVEDMNYSRVCIGRIPVTEIANLMEKHGERLLERNIRRYLGLHGNRVNEGIQETLHSNRSDNFYFFNNGLTIICSDFSYNALQSSDYQIKLENMQIVNGGQTCMTIFKTLQEMTQSNKPLPVDASVLVRIYKLPKDNDIVLQITQATNSQNPVDLKDLRANDEKQRTLEHSLILLGYQYRRKRIDAPPTTNEITADSAAEAILAIWRCAPHQAKVMSSEHFGKLYNTIFTDTLNGTQTIIAVLLHRIAENHRRRPDTDDPVFVRSGSHFIAMQMGKRLLATLNITLEQLNHLQFTKTKECIEQQGEQLFKKAVIDVEQALIALYGQRTLSRMQLAITFHRGDLITYLNEK